MTLSSIWGAWKCPHIHSTSKKQENIFLLTQALVTRVETQTWILRSLLSQPLSLLSAPLAFRAAAPGFSQMNKPAGKHWQGPQGVRMTWGRVHMAVILTGHLAGRSSLPCAERLLQPSEWENLLIPGQLHIPVHLLQGSLLLSVAWSGRASLCRNSLWCQNNPHCVEKWVLGQFFGMQMCSPSHFSPTSNPISWTWF